MGAADCDPKFPLKKSQMRSDHPPPLFFPRRAASQPRNPPTRSLYTGFYTTCAIPMSIFFSREKNLGLRCKKLWSFDLWWFRDVLSTVTPPFTWLKFTKFAIFRFWVLFFTKIHLGHLMDFPIWLKKNMTICTFKYIWKPDFQKKYIIMETD